MCDCSDTHLYFQIGLILVLTYISYGVFLILYSFFNCCVAYVNDSIQSDIPFIMKRPFMLDSSLEHEDDTTKILLSIMTLLLGSAVLLVAWMPLLIFLVGYLLLRSLRFIVRIKKGLFKITDGKKCLKEYTDEDKPKMEF